MLNPALISLDNQVFRCYLGWSAVLVLKIFAAAIYSGLMRFLTATFANPEDLLSPKLKVKFDDPNVERVRRAHRNDLENILPFFAIGLLYVLTDPAAFLAINLFRAVGIARIAHTLVYAVVVVPQPSRAIAFFVAVAATAYMALQVIASAAF
ncbi:microsomal glutathione S-transferase 1 isoform X2 [Drosophila teissieri]|uniref:microsomal glutathione S-transferase 1 isoform X2 n=1 Tax=Drosophila teissieri TaxID=7243 RepID=UPI001CBA3C6B|nr:microsomal glutathione S-transferase 1 isoform X2 [Drosophila teissieri]